MVSVKAAQTFIKERNLESIISLSIYFFVSLLFIVKYLNRLNPIYPILGSTFFLGFIFFLLKFKYFTRRNTLTLLILYSIFAGILVPIFFPVGSFNVDRWDMIEVFNNNLFHGLYPYDAIGQTSGNTPAQSPVYFILCLPFYLTKWYVGIPIAGIWVFYWAINRFSFITQKEKAILITLLSPFFIYETFTCSSIFFNSAIILLWVSYINNKMFILPKSLVINGLIGGLLLCTRNCYIIPMLIIGLTLLHRFENKGAVIIWGLCIFAGYILSILPFVFGWGLDNWFQKNPFRVQSELILSVYCIFVILLGSLFCGLICRNLREAIFSSGLCLFLAAFLTLGETIYKFGFETSYLDSRFDITYLILGIPFLLCFVKATEKYD